MVVLILLGAVMFSGIGLLVASRAKTIEMVSGLMNLVMVPMWIFSGIFFSSERFPESVQPLIKLIPLTPLIDALRAVMLEGAPLAAQLRPIGILVRLERVVVCAGAALVPLAIAAETDQFWLKSSDGATRRPNASSENFWRHAGQRSYSTSSSDSLPSRSSSKSRAQISRSSISSR